MKKKELHRRIPRLPFNLTFIRGHIGKQFVIKHYSYGAIKTKYPDMTRIIASAAQRKCRDLFAEAVAYAKEVIADPELKKAWQKKLRRRNGVYNEAVKTYMLREKRKALRDKLIAETLLWKAMQGDQGVWFEKPESFQSSQSSQTFIQVGAVP